jgi:tRNA uridine 5-carbamoylmethylation protein Kti12
MFMQNFSTLACTQKDLDKFLTIFKENSRIFQENSSSSGSSFYSLLVLGFPLNDQASFRKTLKRIPKKIKSEYAILYLL